MTSVTDKKKEQEWKAISFYPTRQRYEEFGDKLCTMLEEACPGAKWTGIVKASLPPVYPFRVPIEQVDAFERAVHVVGVPKEKVETS